MQLFLLTCGWEGADERRVGAALDAATRPFAGLDAGTRTLAHSEDGAVLVAAMAHSGEVAWPRRYLSRGERELVLYDGLPVHRAGRFPAHDADLLRTHWDEATTELEGQFLAVRVDLAGSRVEIIPDVLAICPLFVARRGTGCVLANSVAAVRHLTGAARADDLGVSSLLTLGWVSGDRTLVEGVTALPGGRTYQWDAMAGLTEVPVMTAATLARPETRRRRSTAEVAESMRSTTGGILALPNCKCALTGGRDTRVVLALTSTVHGTVSFYTIGEPDDADVRIAANLAGELDLAYEVWPPTPRWARGDWPALTEIFIDRTDGLVPLLQTHDMVDQLGTPRRLGVKLQGTGGEAAGGATASTTSAANIPVLHRWHRLHEALQVAKLRDFDGLLTNAAVETARRGIATFLAQRVEEGWPARDLSDAFYTFDRIRRAGATGPRRTGATDDVFAPMISRDFLQYAYALTPAERLTRAGHYRLIGYLAPQLREIPFDRPWSPQRVRLAPALVAANLAQLATRRLQDRLRGRVGRHGAEVPHIYSTLEAALPAHREVVGGIAQDADAWQFVDRNRLIAALHATAQQRVPIAEGLYRALTVLWYFR